MKKIIITSVFLFSTLSLIAQKEANWWHFGVWNSLDFNQTTSVIDNSGELTPDVPKAGIGNVNSLEGCFTLSNKNGELMMYSNGMTIWDKNGNAMPNGSGLLGGSSSSQSGIVIPFPGDFNKYYAISVAENRGSAGITYSVVDMSLRSGLGDVTSIKNMSLRDGPTDENIAAVRKTGSDNYWIIHRDMVNSKNTTFYVWELTPAGFTGPTTYLYTTSFIGSFLGYLKFSSDANRFASPVNSSGGFLSGEFNPATGQITNIKSRNDLGTGSTLYSVEFSLSGEQLFITSASPYAYHISWNDLRNTTKQATSLNKKMSNVQMHPNGHIYGTEKDARTLYVIMDPESGASADIRVFNNYLQNKASYGLPTFIATFMKLNGDFEFCIDVEKEYTMDISNAAATYVIWNFGDGNSDSIITDNNLSTGQQKHSHIYTRPGTYIISVKSYDSSDNLLMTQTFEVKVKSCQIPVNHNISASIPN